jgi:hypothetical protein
LQHPPANSVHHYFKGFVHHRTQENCENKDVFPIFSRAHTICTFTPLIYDKLIAAKYIDEVVEASVNYVNEEVLKEVRPCLKTAEELLRQSA